MVDEDGLHVRALGKLSQVSWAILGLSLLIDTSHIRSFPSYNVVVGLWAYYCGNLKCTSGATQRDNSPSERRRERRGSLTGLSEEMETLLRDVSTFSFVASASIIFDVLFCSVWGGEIHKGESTSAKFSFVMFIFTIFAKMAAVFYAAQVVVGGSSAKGIVERQITHGEERTPGAAPIANGSTEGARSVLADEENGDHDQTPSRRETSPESVRRFSDFVGAAEGGDKLPDSGLARPPGESKPSALFTPGVPGLVSPGATPSVSNI